MFKLEPNYLDLGAVSEIKKKTPREKEKQKFYVKAYFVFIIKFFVFKAPPTPRSTPLKRQKP